MRQTVLAAIAALLLSCAPAGAAAAPLVRKDVTELTASEKDAFVRAVLALKAAPSPYDPELSYYDQFVAWHRELSSCSPLDPRLRDMTSGHNGPMFLPWHREFVWLFERALGEVAGQPIAVPYWDWTDPSSPAAVFTDDFMGGDGDPAADYAVTTGPFRKGRWKLTVHPVGLEWASSATEYVTRRLGTPESLPAPADAEAALAAPHYDVAPYDAESDPAQSFRNAVEGWRPPLAAIVTCGPDGVVLNMPRPDSFELHNLVHDWVGGVSVPDRGPRLFGTMLTVPTSPNDPVFFLHHANIDRLWAQWQERRGVDTYRPVRGYPKNNADDLMEPYAGDGIHATPATVADIDKLGYSYASTRRGNVRRRARNRLVCRLDGRRPAGRRSGR